MKINRDRIAKELIQNNVKLDQTRIKINKHKTKETVLENGFTSSSTLKVESLITSVSSSRDMDREGIKLIVSVNGNAKQMNLTSDVSKIKM